MPYLLRSPNANTPIPPEPSMGGRIENAIDSLAHNLAESYASPYRDVYNTWKGTSKLVTFPHSPPYSGWKPLSDSAKLTVCNQPIPDGVIMTHCRVLSTVSYRATQVRDDVLRTPRLTMSLYTTKDGAKGIDFRVTTLDATVGEAQQNAIEVANRVKTKLINSGVKGAAFEKAIYTNPEIKAALDKVKEAAESVANAKSQAKLHKISLAESQPRSVELRFTVVDVLSTQAILFTRHEVLDRLWRMFCQNPTLSADAVDGSKFIVAASKASAASLQGRFVSLSSRGIDPYKVGTWATTSFQHQEVPDSDLIFVRVICTEVESDCMTVHPAVAPTSAPVVQAAPAVVAKPVYATNTGWAAPPGSEVAP